MTALPPPRLDHEALDRLAASYRALYQAIKTATAKLIPALRRIREALSKGYRENRARRERDALARELQAAGPDEYPWGYYQHLADYYRGIARMKSPSREENPDG